MRRIAQRLAPWAWGLGIGVAVAIPLFTLPRLPSADPAPLLIALMPWIVGKYILCPLRWRALTRAGLTRWWHLRAYAESELLGLLTPGHVGADLWRIRRLTGKGLSGPDAVASVGLDRLVGAIGLAAFVGFAGAALPTRMLLIAASAATAVLVAALVLRRLRPELMPSRPRPRGKDVLQGLVLSAGYQLSIAVLLYGSVQATGHALPPLALLGAFGASQIAGAVPGPAGASPRDGALVIALASLGLPWSAAAAAVALTAVIAWLPALVLGGPSLMATRRSLRPAVA
jgi:uncharacterized membrane protein YbhN (UPF0104 family)